MGRPKGSKNRAKAEKTEEQQEKLAPSAGGNLTKLMEKAREWVSAIHAINADIKALNADKQAIIEAAEAEGINRDALKLAVKFDKMDPEKRDSFDESFSIVRESIGKPFDGELNFTTEQAKANNDTLTEAAEGGLDMPAGVEDTSTNVDTPNPSSGEIKLAYNDGRKARFNGLAIDSNPHSQAGKLRDTWAEGWRHEDESEQEKKAAAGKSKTKTTEPAQVVN